MNKFAYKKKMSARKKAEKKEQKRVEKVLERREYERQKYIEGFAPPASPSKYTNIPPATITYEVLEGEELTEYKLNAPKPWSVAKFIDNRFAGVMKYAESEEDAYKILDSFSKM